MASQASDCVDSPLSQPLSVDDQFETIRNAVNRAEMREGDTWYLIDSRWFKQWKRYVGWDTWDQSSKGNESAMPGPIDNSNLLTESGSLKQHLTEMFNLVLLPETAWKPLVSWFGIVDGQSPIERTVIQQGLYVKSLKVEVYLTEVKLNVYGKDKKDEVKATFSRAEKLRNVIEYARKALDVEVDKEVRVWSGYMGSFSVKLDKYEDTLQDHGVYSGQALVLELKNDDGTWPKQTEYTSSYNYGNYSRSSYQSKVVDKGLTGLSNLGNTCFMNSALQCLSNVPTLTEYFLTNEYKGEINRDNPLGMRGQLAESYGELMHDMWSERAVVAPRRLKTEVGRFAPRFQGCQQHDSQELLAFLLDGLHEDLNRVIQKPDVEMKRDSDGRPDEEVAAEAWENHQKKNRSIFVDYTHGQYKSTLVCPDCGKVSVTFDPFMYLTLPLPVKKTKRIPLTLVRKDPTIPPIKYRVNVRKNGVISDIADELEKMTGIPSNLLVITDIYNGKMYKVFHENESIITISTQRDNVHAYELPVNDVDDEKTALVVFYHRTWGSFGSSSCFGLPMVLGVPRRDTTYRLLYERIVQHMRRFVTVQKNHRELFRMTFVNSYGSSDIGEIDKENPIRFKKTTYVALDWAADGKKSYDEDAANNTLEDESWLVKPAAPVVPTLRDCIELFTEKETLSEEDPWYCSKCKKHREADKTMTLWKLPEVLLVHLKRYSYSRYWQDKLDTYVEFPIENLDMSDLVKGPIGGKSMLYDLCAVSNHYGGVQGGHYTAYCKNKTTGDWYHFDDSSVNKVEDVEATVRSRAAYLLIYLRKEVVKVSEAEVRMSEISLGSGSYGAVCVGSWRGCQVAVKTFYKFFHDSDHTINQLQHEVWICHHVRHPNVVSLLGVITKNGVPHSILSELLEGSLSDVMEAAGGKLTLREQLDVAVGCSAGLRYLHEKNVLHGDIRPTNVVLTSLMEAKFCDLGASRLASHPSRSLGPLSFPYLAPERFPSPQSSCHQHHTKMADIYSLGVTFIELMTGQKPDPGERMAQAKSIHHRLIGKLAAEMVNVTPRERPLIGKCLSDLIAIQDSDQEYRRCPNKRIVKGKVHGGKRVHLVEKR